MLHKSPGSTTACCWTGCPIGVAGWETTLVEKLPEDLKGSLPTVEEIEAELAHEGKNR